MINVSRRIYQIFWNPKGLKKKKKLILELFSRGHIFIVLGCSVMSDSLHPHGLQPTRLLCPWRFSRQEYWSGFDGLLQGIFPTQELNPGLLHLRWILLQLSHQGGPRVLGSEIKKNKELVHQQNVLKDQWLQIFKNT